MSVSAARPTYFAAVGKAAYGGVRSRQTSGKDQNAHTKLKLRVVGQNTVSEMSEKNLRTDLDVSEQKETKEATKAITMLQEEESKINVPLLLKHIPEADAQLEILKKYVNADADADVGGGGKADDDFDSSSDEDDDDDEDDEAELQAELDRIREERASAQLKKEEEEKEMQTKAQRETSMKSNPLVNIGGGESDSSMMKRRWNDDVVFRNQTRDEPTLKKRFINDAIRSDFHRSFLKKFIR